MSSLESEIDPIVASALRQYREFQFAMITLMLYDHAITLGREVDLPFHLSFRAALRKQIRYLTLALSADLWRDRECEPSSESIDVQFIPDAWSTPLQLKLSSPFASGDIDKLFTSTTETTLRSPEQIMWLFVPSVTNHSILFVLKVYRFMQSGKSLHMEPPMRRFLKESVIHILLCTSFNWSGNYRGSLVSTIVRLSFTAPSEISIYLVALASLPTAAVVVAVCRAMLSIRSLAATFHVDPEWLLSNAEMSRLPLREGPNKSELCVELFCPQ
ncbi:hypothetical protein EDD16DRAFT_1518816 [Pisolithus croceorrhizus]|nr:hypothetical protein EDD16DRAFT_1518816 [Pisolithus croceorrhizus]